MLRDVAVVVLCQLAAACVIGLLLPHVADLAQAVRTEDGVVTGEVQLGKTFNDDGWLIVLGGAAGLVLGIVLQVWRRSHEVVTLVAIVVSALAAAWLAGWIADPQAIKPGARMPAALDIDGPTLNALAAYLEHLK